MATRDIASFFKKIPRQAAARALPAPPEPPRVSSAAVAMDADAFFGSRPATVASVAPKRKAEKPAEGDEYHPAKKKAPPKSPPAASVKVQAADSIAETKPVLLPETQTQTQVESTDTAKKPAAFWKLKQNKGPAAPGSKLIPEGAANCLQGLTFVFTGELSSISREDAQDLVKRYGGRVTSAPSSRTSYVILGDDAGPKKLEKIAQLSIRTLDEDEFLALVGSKPAQEEKVVIAPIILDEDVQMPQAVSSSAVAKLSPASSQISEPQTTEPRAMEPRATEPAATRPSLLSEYRLWTDKYRPRVLKDLCGNKSSIETLLNWLKTYGPATNNRAVLISGPPGIGKTTAAFLTCQEAGYDVKELNASEARSKGSLDQLLKSLIDTHSISEYRTGGSRQKIAVVMDECDGMSAGDRGGIAELILLIKRTQVPIICICNDRQSPKVKSLANHCIDMRFRRPEVTAIRSRIMSIAHREKLKIPSAVVDQLVSTAQSDIRQVLNILSSWTATENVIDYDQGKELSASTKKHIAMGPYDITSYILGGYSMHSLPDLIEAYFHDFSISPLMVQENYINLKPAMARATTEPRARALHELELIRNAACSISDGDLIDAMIHGSQQQWGLLPAHAVLSCVIPAYHAHGAAGGMYGFPSWLGQNSKTLKGRRLVADMVGHTRLKISGNAKEFRQLYVPALQAKLVDPLIAEGTAGVPTVIKTLDQYYLTKENWDSINELVLDSSRVDLLTTQAKAALTRTYNKGSHPVPYASAVTAKKAAARRSTSSADVPDFEEAVVNDDDAGADEEEEEDVPKALKKVTAAKKPAAARGGKRGTGRGR